MIELYIGIYLLGVLISSISQVLLKKAALHTYDSPLKEYLNPLVITAYAFFFGATLMTILAYKVVPLSFGPVLESSSYLYVTVFGVLIFKEKMTKKKAAALALILMGIVIYSLGIPAA